MKKIRFLLARRFIQIALILLYGSANWFGFKFLQGNMSESLLMSKVPLTDPYAVLQMFCAGAIVGIDALIGVLIIVVFYALIGGRAFCAWVCPINLITDFANYVRRKIKVDELGRKVWLSRKTRYFILVLGLVVSFATGVAAYELVNPIGILSRGLIYGAGLGSTVIAGVFLFDLFAIKNGFCGHLCPVGGMYSLIGKFSIIRVKHNKDNCTECMNCISICPERQVLNMIGKESSYVSGMECTNCGRCIEVCNDDALDFKLRVLNK